MGDVIDFPNSAPPTPGQTRLHINLNSSTAKSLKELMAKYDTTATVEIWKMVSLYSYLEETVSNGGQLMYKDDSGRLYAFEFGFDDKGKENS